MKANCRAQLYLSLSRALEAGLTPERSLLASMDTCDGTLAQPIRRCANAVRKGSALTPTLERHELITELDAALVWASEAAGRPDLAFAKLAERYERSHARESRFKAKMLFPLAVLVLSLVLTPLPAVVAGTLSVSAYVWNTTALLLALTLTCWLALAVARHWRSHGLPYPVGVAVRAMPVLGRLLSLHERADVNERLAMMLEAGVAVRQACEAMHGAELDSIRKVSLTRLLASLGGGSGVADSMLEAGLLDQRQGFAIVSTGEAAGRLDRSLTRYAEICHETLDGIYDDLGRWLPVVAYALVSAWILGGLLG